jgi:hypothetical protein
MSKCYKIIPHTPFVGEDGEAYWKGDTNSDKFRSWADECIYENAQEWLDQVTIDDYYDGDEEAYWEECGYSLKEISEEEYNEAISDGYPYMEE